jgi:histidinol-phosphate aminotransferase
LEALSEEVPFQINKEIILQERKKLIEKFTLLANVKKVYKSDANFILVEVNDANKLYETLVEAKVITRNRNSVVRNCLRITVGSEEENKRLISILESA